jgi:hypothetical protein
LVLAWPSFNGRKRGSGASLYLQRDGRVVRGTGLPRSNLDAPGCGQNSSAPRLHVARRPDLLVQPGWGSSGWTWGRCADDLPNPGGLGVWGADGHASLTVEGVMGRGKYLPLGSMPWRPDGRGSMLMVITAAGRITWRPANAIADTNYSRREGGRGMSRLAKSSLPRRRSLWG